MPLHSGITHPSDGRNGAPAFGRASEVRFLPCQSSVDLDGTAPRDIGPSSVVTAEGPATAEPVDPGHVADEVRGADRGRRRACR
jgi:hypothetical protein